MHPSNSLLLALTLGFTILALPGCASSSSTKPDGSNVSAAPAPQRGITPDRNLTATITRVQHSAGQTLAEIDAGERDGVQKHWVMTIADNGNFVGNLRILNVDVNRSTGVISLEQGTNRVTVGQKVFATPDS